MTPEQQAAFIMTQAVCALAEIAGMQAENKVAASVGTVRYRREDFEAVTERYVIGHNAVISFFEG